MFELNGQHTKAKIFADVIDDACIGQIQRMINHPAFDGPVRIMPDAHAGKGSVVGFTMPVNPSKVVPNVIGVDIGCGMGVRKISKDAMRALTPSKLSELDKIIRDSIPCGREVHPAPIYRRELIDPWFSRAAAILKVLHESFSLRFPDMKFPIVQNSHQTQVGMWMSDFRQGKIPHWCEPSRRRSGIDLDRVLCSMGTLGGGNHFIELALPSSPNLNNLNYGIVVVHSGSRQFGKGICDFWQRRAGGHHFYLRYNAFQEALHQVKASGASGQEIGQAVVRLKAQFGMNEKSRDLDYLQDPEDVGGYWLDMVVAQTYALFNRYLMLDIIERAIATVLGVDVCSIRKEGFDCAHNNIDFQDLVIRKGACRAALGDQILIPINMQDGSLLAVGRGNPDWNYSAPHGAGRLMSRAEAKRSLSMDDFRTGMEQAGVFSTSVVQDTLDEAPKAYKSIESIRSTIGNTVEVLGQFKPILNIKAVR